VGSPIPDATTRSAAPQWLRAAEPLAVFSLIMLYIWWLRPMAPYAWAPMLALVLASHRLRGEGAGALGFRLANFRACVRDVGPALVFIALLLYVAGALLETARPIGFDRALLVLIAYIPWGLFQQYLLNGYFVNRFAAAFAERYVPVLSAALFSGAHLPNPFLMVVTLLAGHVCARIYLRYRNLYFLGLAHAAIGFLLYFTIPNAIIRNLNVGPAWFRWK
jgi:hypothetical protein